MRRQAREWAIGGVFGNWVQVTDGRHKYARGADGDELPPLHVVQPVVDHDDPRPGGPGPPAAARPARPAGLHAGHRRARHPPALRAGRPPPLLGRSQRRRRALPLRPGRRTRARTRTGRATGGAEEADMVELLRVALQGAGGARGATRSGSVSRDGGAGDSRWRCGAVRPAAHPGFVRRTDLRRRWTAPHRQPHVQGALDDPGRNHGGRRRDAVGGVPTRGGRRSRIGRHGTVASSWSTSSGPGRRSRAGCGSSSTAAWFADEALAADRAAGGGVVRTPPGRARPMRSSC